MEDPVIICISSLLRLRGKGLIDLLACKVNSDDPKINKETAQNLIEYAIVVALISAAVAALSTYVFRSVQAEQKMITEDSLN